MKNFYLIIVFLFLLLSCSTEEDFPSGENASIEKNSPARTQNKNKHLDEKGNKYIISEPIKGTVNSNKRTLSITAEDVVLIMNDPQNQLIEIVETSSLDTAAKTNLLDFVETLIERQGDDYADVNAYVATFESNVSQSNNLDQAEKDMILTVSIIARYSLFMEWSIRDRDWETSVGNRGPGISFDINAEPIISLLAIIDNLI